MTVNGKKLQGINLSNDLSAIGYALIMLDNHNTVTILEEEVSDIEHIVLSVGDILADNQVDYDMWYSSEGGNGMAFKVYV